MTETTALEIPADLDWDVADKLRKAMRYADVGVGEMADYLGVSRQTVGRWINGHTPADRRTLRLWALRCGVPYEWLTDARSVSQRSHYESEPVGGAGTNGATNDPGTAGLSDREAIASLRKAIPSPRWAAAQ